MGAIDQALFASRQLVKRVRGRDMIDLSGTAAARTKFAPPGPMQVLLERAPMSNNIRIVYPDGQTELMAYNPQIRVQLAKRGLPYEKLERIIDYLWNFYHVYVDCVRTPAPPQMMPVDSTRRTQ